ncbi:MAG: hypothetical protein U5K00_12230 [Melioribacteraceae bacterium]|nr:hypothetical protein [Melioribacteraceae bacterium]
MGVYTVQARGGGGSTTYYTITSTAGVHGSISPLGSVSVAEGNNQSYTITPSVDYIIDDVLVDNVSVGAVAAYQFSNVTAAHTIHAEFEPVVDTTFVAITGDDTNGDGSRANPYRTIQRGHNRTDYGGIVYIYNGNYAEDVVLTKPISMIGETNPSTRSFLDFGQMTVQLRILILPTPHQDLEFKRLDLRHTTFLKICT